ncbi:hypothetical protein FHQ23_08365, partial [Testudinibacter sp. TR-2022]|uniref:YadA family autotransporter adhesin n=1 Tax=Testudinibacter sp. TR-2022 TaxID=2585029 RepID=UPI0011748AB4
TGATGATGSTGDINTAGNYVTYDVSGNTTKETGNVVEAIGRINAEGIKYVHVNSGQAGTVAKDRANGDSSASGKYAVAIGRLASAESDNAVAVGNQTTVSGKNTVAVGAEITATVDNSVYLGYQSNAESKQTAQTAGSGKYEPSSQIKEILGAAVSFAGSDAAGVVTVGSVGKERRIQNVAAGLVAEGSTDAVNGSQLYAVATLADAIKNGTAGLVQQAPSKDTSVKINNNPITVGAATGGDEVNFSNSSNQVRRLTGVAAGVNATDAVNKGQLDAAIGGVNRRLDSVERYMKSGISNAIATASLPQAYGAGQSVVSVGVGNFKGSSSIAVGVSKVSDNGKVILKLNGSTSNSGDVAVGAGVGFAW